MKKAEAFEDWALTSIRHSLDELAELLERGPSEDDHLQRFAMTGGGERPVWVGPVTDYEYRIGSHVGKIRALIRFFPQSEEIERYLRLDLEIAEIGLTVPDDVSRLSFHGTQRHAGNVGSGSMGVLRWHVYCRKAGANLAGGSINTTG